jgi:hypothetical protein
MFLAELICEVYLTIVIGFSAKNRLSKSGGKNGQIDHPTPV